jgi:hypothetical protein
MALTSAISRIVVGVLLPCICTTCSTISIIAVNFILPAKNAATATSFAALNTAGSPPPNSPQRLAKSIAGYF